MTATFNFWSCFLQINWWLQHYFFTFLLLKVMTATFNFRSLISYESIQFAVWSKGSTGFTFEFRHFLSAHLAVGWKVHAPISHNLQESTMYPEFHSDISMLASFGQWQWFCFKPSSLTIHHSWIAIRNGTTDRAYTILTNSAKFIIQISCLKCKLESVCCLCLIESFVLGRSLSKPNSISGNRIIPPWALVAFKF